MAILNWFKKKQQASANDLCKQKISKGMTKEKVQSLLGKPTKVVSFGDALESLQGYVYQQADNSSASTELWGFEFKKCRYKIFFKGDRVSNVAFRHF